MAQAWWLGSCPRYSVEAARHCSQEHLVLTWNMLQDIFRRLLLLLFLITPSFSDTPDGGRPHGFAKNKSHHPAVCGPCVCL